MYPLTVLENRVLKSICQHGYILFSFWCLPVIVGIHWFSFMLVCLSVSDFLTLWPYVAWKAPLSMEFSRQEYWSGLLCPTPGYLPHPGIKPVSPALAGGFCTNCATWEGLIGVQGHNFTLCPCHLIAFFPLGLYVITWPSFLGVLVCLFSSSLFFLMLEYSWFCFPRW